MAGMTQAPQIGEEHIMAGMAQAPQRGEDDIMAGMTQAPQRGEEHIMAGMAQAPQRGRKIRMCIEFFKCMPYKRFVIVLMAGKSAVRVLKRSRDECS